MKNKQNETLLFRMVDYSNITCLLGQGMYCASHEIKCKNYVNIGHETLINNRNNSKIPILPNGVLADYIPFYFAYKMPMLYAIHKNKVKNYAENQENIVYLVTNAEKIAKANLQYVFTNRHAVLKHSQYFNNILDLPNLYWDVIDEIDYNEWKCKNQDTPEFNKEKKQAEFLVYQYFPILLADGFAVANDKIKDFIVIELAKQSLNIPVYVVPKMFF